MQTSLEALRILHDPAGYYRPWQGHMDAVTPPQRAALNAWLATECTLPAAAPAAAHDVLATRLIRGWQRVPATAWLMACAAHRSSVLGSRTLLQQPPAVHAFLMLGLGAATPSRRLPPDQLLAWGGHHLQAGLHPLLPDWLGARIRLWFAGLPTPPPEPHGPPVPFDMTCFWSAWNHAADLPGPPAGLCH